MKLNLGLACDIVVIRTIDSNERARVSGNLFNQDVIVKYEIENFKDTPAVLNVSESLRHIRSEVRAETGRDVQWDLGPDTTFPETMDREKSTFDKVIFRVLLPARAAGGQADKVAHKLHVIIKNEW